MKRLAMVLVGLMALARLAGAQEQTITDQVILGTAGCLLRAGSGTPEAAVVGKVCDQFVRTDTGDVYRKTSGTGNTGWSLTYRASGTDVPVPDGGTGVSSFTSNGVIYGQGSSALAVTAAGGANTVLTANGGAPSFSATPTVTSLTANTSVTTPSLLAAANLSIAPTGDVVFDPTGNDLLPNTGYDLNIGSLSKKYLTLHAAELWVETLVAQDTIATIGGRILVGPTTQLTADLSAGATTIQVKHNQMVSGDRVYLEANGAIEFLAITSGAGGSAGAYTYSVTRNLDGSGANAWSAGDAVFNTGTTGKGFIDLYSTSGVLSGSGPTIVGNVRTGTTYSDIAPRWAIGNLNGLYSYVADTYGVAMGDPSGSNIVIDSTNGIRIRQSTTDYAVMAASLFRLGASSGNRVEWNGTNLTVVQSNLTIDSTGIVMTTPSAYVSTNGYRFATSGSIAGSLYGLFAQEPTSSTRSVILYNFATTSNKDAVVFISADNTGQTASISLAANNTTNPSGTFALSEIDYSARNHRFTLGGGASMTFNSTGFTATAFGTNAFSGGGTGDYAALTVEAGTNTTSGLYAYSQGYTTTGQAIADSLQLFSSGSGGLNFTANHASGRMRFKVASNLAFEIDANGDVVSPVDSTQHIGVPSRRFAYMTALAFNLTDMSLDNGWSLTEAERIGIAEPGVALVNKAGELIAFFGEETFYTKKHGDIDVLPYTVTTLDDRIHMDRTPEIRIKGYDADGLPIFKTAADVPPMPKPTDGKTNTQRKAVKAGGQ